MITYSFDNKSIAKINPKTKENIFYNFYRGE